MNSDGRVFLPRALPAARHVQGGRPADPDRPRRIRALGTRADAPERRRQQEGHAATADYPRKPHADAVDDVVADRALAQPPHRWPYSRIPSAPARGAHCLGHPRAPLASARAANSPAIRLPRPLIRLPKLTALAAFRPNRRPSRRVALPTVRPANSPSP